MIDNTYPNMIICTEDCNCDDIIYKIKVCFDPDNTQDVSVESRNLLPFLGRMIELLNIHRTEATKLSKQVNNS